MASLAQRLPVVLIPEQLFVSAMRNDVVDHRSRREHAMRQAAHAQWMLLQKAFARKPPPGVIAAPSSAATQSVGRFGAVLRAICAALAEVGTTRIAAGTFWCSWHIDLK